MRAARALVRGLAVAALLAAPATGLAKDPAPGGKLDDDARRKAAVRGIDHLQETVHRLSDPDGTPRKPFTAAISGLCFLLDPRTSDRGNAHVQRMRDYLLRWLDDVAARIDDPDELPTRHGRFTSNRLIQYTWPVAAAGLFFGEMHARGIHREDARDALETIVDVLERSQQSNGSWGHGLVSGRESARDDLPEGLRREMEEKLGTDAADRMAQNIGGYPDTLVSSAALVAATLGHLDTVLRNDVKGLGGARRYFREARLRDGSYPYDPSQRSAVGSVTNVGRTAGALWAWKALGMPEDDAYRESQRYLLRRLADVPEGHGSPCLNVLYGVMWARAAGEDELLLYREAVEPRIIAAQREGGVLPCVCVGDGFGVTCDSESPFAGVESLDRARDAYTTALHTLVLLIPSGKMRLLDKEPKPAGAVTPR
jgi:hypothetical protein